jgi:hypothetical protein
VKQLSAPAKSSTPKQKAQLLARFGHTRQLLNAPQFQQQHVPLLSAVPIIGSCHPNNLYLRRVFRSFAQNAGGTIHVPHSQLDKYVVLRYIRLVNMSDAEDVLSGLALVKFVKLLGGTVLVASICVIGYLIYRVH